jgi:hypothetical protein
MRYISGYDASVTLPLIRQRVWPFTHGVPAPGPTLRARVGDRVQITLLNHVNVKNFPGTLDVAEHGDNCDQNKSVGPGGTSVNTYPGDPSFENPPNCFHGSSSTNLHFHGAHTSPSGIADNVLLNIRPSPRGRDGKPTVNEQTVKPIFDLIFAACAHGKQPLLWKDWPLQWQTWQKKLLQAYDSTAVWHGQVGALPVDQRLWTQNVKENEPDAAAVAAVLHRRFSQLLPNTGMEWQEVQHGPGAWNALVSRSQTWIDRTEPGQRHGRCADH